MDREDLLRQLADQTLDKRTEAAQQLQAAGLRVVATKERDAVDVEATLDMWEYPHPVQLWGRKRLPVIDPTELLAGKEVELDPIDLTELSDGFNHATAADWQHVTDEHRALVRYGIKTGRLQVADPLDLAAQLSEGRIPPRLKVLEAEATAAELAEAAKELRRMKRPQMAVPPPVVLVGTAHRTKPHELLAELFNASELKRFIAGYCPQCQHSIQWHHPGGMLAITHDTIERLRQHGVLNDAFWRALIAERPGRAAEIVALQDA